MYLPLQTRGTEAAQALAVLGYTSAEVAQALKGVDVENLPLEEIIRQSLKKMVKEALSARLRVGRKRDLYGKI